jgi:uncharacterized protein YoaH (UPF0181 family)
MTTLTQLTKDLGIGKGTLYKTLSDLEITPHQQGRKRVLDDNQVQRIRSAIVSASDPRPSETVNRQTRDAKADDSNVVNVLQKQIEHLKILLDSEKSEKSQLLQRLEQEQGSSERIQQLLSVSMSEGSKLRVEVDRLRLLDHQPTIQTAEPPKEFEDIEEEIQQVDPVIATAEARSSRVGWIAISVCAISALGWVISQLPSVGEDFGRW